MKEAKLRRYLTRLLAAALMATGLVLSTAYAQNASGGSSCPTVSTSPGSVVIVQERDASLNVSSPPRLLDGRYRIELRLTPDPDVARRVQLTILTSTDQGGEAYSITSVDRNEQAWQRITPYFPTVPSRKLPKGFTLGITEMAVGVLHNADGGVGFVVVSSPRANGVTKRPNPVAYPWDTFSVTRLHLDASTFEVTKQQCQERGEFADYIAQPGALWVREMVNFTQEISPDTQLTLTPHYLAGESACRGLKLACLTPQISAPRTLSPAAAVDPQVFFSYDDIRDELQSVKERLMTGNRRQLIAAIPRCARTMFTIDYAMRDSLLLTVRWKQSERLAILRAFQRWARTRSRLPTAGQLGDILNRIEQLQQQALEDAKTLPADGSLP